MTVAYLDLPLHPEAHGFRAVTKRNGRAAVAKGRTKAHERRLDAYQRDVRLAALDWIEERDGRWPHYNDAVFLGFIGWLRRPTTYKAAEMWHRTRKGGPRRNGGGSGGDRLTLARAVEDALSGALYRDDGQVSLALEGKPLVAHTDHEHVEVWVAPMDDAQAALDEMLARLPIRQINQTC